MDLTTEQLTILAVLVNSLNENDTDAALGFPTAKLFKAKSALIEKGLLDVDGNPTELGIKTINIKASGKIPGFDKICKNLTPSAVRMLILSAFNSLSIRHKNRRSADNFYFQDLIDRILDETANAGQDSFVEYYKDIKTK